jgi:hypothetical protein
MDRTYARIVHTNGRVSIVSSDGWSFVEDPANSDYQAYLAWLAEGNEPEVID